MPKAGEPGLRLLTWLDPYDEIALRVLVGRMVPSIEAGLNRDELFSYQLGASGPRWWTKPHREPIKQRQARGLELLASASCGGLGTLDVEEYYRSVSPDALGDVLGTFGAPLGAVDALITALRELRSSGAPGGLPIGFEGSGILANAFLRPLDDAVRPLAPLIRYTDDVWVFPRSWGEFEVARSAASAAAAGLGLRLNDKKCWFWDKRWDSPEDQIRHRTLDSITGAGGGRVPAAQAIEMLSEQAGAQYPDWRIIRFALGNVASAREPAALDVLYANPLLFVEEPVRVGKFLTALARDAATANAIDREWLVGIAEAKSDPRGLARRLHACVAASHLTLSTAYGRRLFDVATSISDHQQAPLQVWAATAWGASRAWKEQAAVDAAEHYGRFSVRRAFCLSLRRGQGSPARRAMWRRHLERVEPDLAPTIGYALS